MPMPSWDPVIGSLGGILDLIVIILHLNTEWSRSQGLISTISTSKDSNVIFKTASKSLFKCENCNHTGHMKARCWAKGGGLEGQYPEWFKGKKDPCTSNSVKAITETPIVWTLGSTG